MTVNVGSTDRIIRAIVGVILIALVFVGPQTPWGWIGIIPLATALMVTARPIASWASRPARKSNGYKKAGAVLRAAPACHSDTRII